MTTLRLHNTLSRTKEDFAPLDPTNVRMYVCGPTVYDYAHIGNARPAIVFDVLFRLLRHIYGPDHVTYVRNITDIDDKINARALELKGERNIPILEIVRELTVGTAKIYEDDMAALGCLPPTHSPRATRHIPQMIAMIQALIEAGHAYAADGHVLFDVSSKPDYGKLAKRSLDDMIAGARVDPAPYKKSPMDFVLWKPSDAQTPGWDSPWGFGRPGWHLECSAMSAEYLGETFDIHGGGIDLVFPHHENEIAQSEGAHHDHPIARVWMHNGHLNVEGAKMSKSLGNFVTVHDLLREWEGEVLRFNMLQTRYRQPIDWTRDGVERAFDAYYEFLDVVDRHEPGTVDGQFIEALCDDLNTPKAFARLHELKSAAVKGNIEAGANLHASLKLIGLVGTSRPGLMATIPQVRHGAAAETIATAFLGQFPRNLPLWRLREILCSKETIEFLGPEVDATLGLFELASVGALVGHMEDRLDDIRKINEAIANRSAAKKAKNFAEADRIRDELIVKGIVLKDGPQGTTWEVKR